MESQQDIQIISADTEQLRTEFIRLPWDIQAHDPLWVAPTVSKQKKFLDPARGAFFEIGEAQLFLARKDGKTVGRISAHINSLHDRLHSPDTGFFGFFECFDSQPAANALFHAASEWLRVRGKRKMVGPFSFSVYDDIGILVDGFDTMPAILLTHNPKYYERLVTEYGMRKAIDWYALKATNRDVDPGRMAAEADRIMKRNKGLAMSAPEPSDVVRRSSEIYSLFNEAWQSNWYHIPFTQKQFKDIFSELKPILRSDLIRIVEDSGRIVAFTITIPDLNATIQRLNGRMNVWDMARLYIQAQWKPLQRLKIVLLGVHQKYQGRRIHDAMILDTYVHVIRNEPEFQFCDCSLISEPLGFFIQSLGRYGTHVYKTYRIFEKEI